MLFRSFPGTVLCELVVYLFLFVTLISPYVSAAAIPRSSLSDASHARNTFTAAPEHLSWSLEARWPDQVSGYLGVFRGSGTVNVVARETTTGDPSVPTDTPSSTQTTAQTTTFSQPAADPSATFSDPFPPDPLPTEDLDPPQVDTGVPTWAWGVGGAGIGIVALFGAAKLVSWCARKPAPE